MRILPIVLALGLSASAALAQPADLPIPPATTDKYPDGVQVVKSASGPVYADAKGRTLYGMDMRILLRWSPNPAMYCQAECAKDWEPMLAPPGSQVNIRFPRGRGEQANRPGEVPVQYTQPQKAPDWTIIEGPSGPQWVYKGWNMVYIRKGDKRGSTKFEGADHLTWNTLKFVPPVPKIAAPSNVATAFADGAYFLTDKDGRTLFTGVCHKDCAGWSAYAGGMASRGIGEWSIINAGDTPQWAYRGKPVYVATSEDPAHVPAGAVKLQP